MTISMIVYLAQIGCYVPCDSAIMPIFDKIFTKFSTFED